MDTSLLNFVNAKRLCLFCPMMQKLCWNYFAFNQSYLVEGKIAPVVLLPHEAKWNYMILPWRIRTGADWWFSKICGSGLDRIRTGLGLKNFTVRSSLLWPSDRFLENKIWVFALWKKCKPGVQNSFAISSHNAFIFMNYGHQVGWPLH